MPSWINKSLLVISTAALAQSILVFPPSVFAQSTDPQTVSYTQAQAVAGKITYDINCASCHGVNLEGAPLFRICRETASS